jgi:hypothetical protein
VQELQIAGQGFAQRAAECSGGLNLAWRQRPHRFTQANLHKLCNCGEASSLQLERR